MIISAIKNSAKLILSETIISVKHYSGVLVAKTSGKYSHNLKLHCGCGNRYIKGWVNIDIEGKCDLHLDLRKKLPFPNDCVDYIISEHFLEHLIYPHETMLFLSECHRVLKRTGKICIGVPDTQWAISGYMSGWKSPWLVAVNKYGWHPRDCVTKLDHLNYHFRQNTEHKYAYDYETISHILKDLDFKCIKKQIKNSLHSWAVGTLYVEAIK
jgi:predicted SAM-dependent methyltransferase